MKTLHNRIHEILRHNFDPRTEITTCEESRDVFLFYIPEYISINALDALLICYYPNKVWDFVHLSTSSKRRLKVFDEKFANHLRKYSLELELLGIEEQKVIVERPVVTYIPIAMKAPKNTVPSHNILDTFCDFTWDTWNTGQYVFTNRKQTAIQLISLGFTYTNSTDQRVPFIRGNSRDLLEYVQEKKEDFFYQSLPPEQKKITLVSR